MKRNFSSFGSVGDGSENDQQQKISHDNHWLTIVEYDGEMAGVVDWQFVDGAYYIPQVTGSYGRKYKLDKNCSRSALTNIGKSKICVPCLSAFVLGKIQCIDCGNVSPPN